MVVTPREIDLLIDRAAKLVSMAINHALQPSFTLEDLGTWCHNPVLSGISIREFLRNGQTARLRTKALSFHKNAERVGEQ